MERDSDSNASNSRPFEFDAIVIGSGFGGGTAALRLSQAGKRVLVLERGPRWRGKNLAPRKGDPHSIPFPELGQRRFFWGRQFWKPWLQRLGLYDLTQFVNLQGLTAAGVGGGSLIWANTVIEAPENIFANNWPKDVNRAVLERYYRLAEPYLRPSFVPGVPGVTDGRNAHLVKRSNALKVAAAKVDRPWSPVRIAVNFGDQNTPFENGHGRARQLGCNYCGLCSAGCPQNAKNTVDLSYIAEAESLGAVVRPLHEVTGIEALSSGDYRVHFKRYNEEGKLMEVAFLDAPRVVLSAGTFGTTKLLLKSRFENLLPNLSDALGTRFSINGNVLSGALKSEATPAQIARVETNTGPAITSMIDYGHFVVEDFANPTWANGIVGGTNRSRIWAFLKALIGIKASKKSLERKAQDMLVYVGVGQDSARGRLVLNSMGSLSLEWAGGINREPVVRDLHKALTKLARVQGRKYIPNVFSVLNRPLTYHPLGGCPMAERKEDGVVDSCGRVFGHRGLYIADGSVVPTAIGRNPAFTIAALSERIVENILQEMQ